MRLIKMFGLAGLTVVAAMAFLGASSASANQSTALCKVHQEPCAANNLATSVHMVAGITSLKTSIATVLCLSSLVQGTPEPLGKPQGVTLTQVLWNNCGTNAAHNNCTVTTLKPGLIDVLKTALNLGTAEALNTQVLVFCDLFIDLHCVYGGASVKGFSVEGALHTAAAGHGRFIAKELEVPNVSGAFCPEKSFWTASYEGLEHQYIVS